MTKITSLAALTAPADDDVLPIVDVSDTSMAPSGTTKKITRANVFATPWSRAGADVLTANAMGALVIDTTKVLNTKTISADSTLTLSGAPAADNTIFDLAIINSDSSAHIITLPAGTWYSYEAGRAVTTLIIPAGGRVLLKIRFVSGSDYEIIEGFPLTLRVQLASDVVIDAGANVFSAITGLLLPVEIGIYNIVTMIAANTGATTTGNGIRFSGPAINWFNVNHYSATNSGSPAINQQYDYATPSTAQTNTGGAGSCVFTSLGLASFSAAGNLQLNGCSELAAGNPVTFRAGSFIELTRIA